MSRLVAPTTEANAYNDHYCFSRYITTGKTPIDIVFEETYLLFIYLADTR